VRPRGVMEKCSFCVQRIEDVRQRAKVETGRSGTRSKAGMRSRLPGGGNHVRRCERPAKQGFKDVENGSGLPHADRARSEAVDHLPGGYFESRDRKRQGMNLEALSVPEEALPAVLRTPPVLEGPVSPGSLDDQVLAPVERKPPAAWFIAITCTSISCSWGWPSWGTGRHRHRRMGNNIPVAWAFDIINFVFWIGIGHAGTLISAILLLFRARWRNSISRFAEAMTIFAVIVAGIFPAFTWGGHGWLSGSSLIKPEGDLAEFPFSPHVGCFCVSTYFSVSLLFWYLGLMPDFASLRDRTKSRIRKFFYAVLAAGCGIRIALAPLRESLPDYRRIATGLVLSVHSVVSFDFAVSLVPGWHMTIFPPYFVTGAIFAGFAMVVMAMVVVRETMNLKNVITMYHLEVMNKIILTCSCLMAYAYIWRDGRPGTA